MSKTALLQSRAESATRNQAPATLQDKAQRYPYETIANNEREHFWFIARNERISRLMKNSLEDWKTASFLEIGAGTGNVLGHLHEEGFQNLSGWEIVEEGFAICQKRYPQISFSNRNFLLENIETKFDSIGMFDCLEHFSDDQLPLKRVRELLKPGGKLYLTVPAHQFLWTVMDEIFGHYRRYGKRDLEQSLVSAGFTNVRSVYFMAPLVPIAIVHRGKLRVPKNASEDQINAIMRRETSLPLRPINSAMLALVRMEHNLMGMRDLNFGGSILTVATNPV